MRTLKQIACEINTSLDCLFLRNRKKCRMCSGSGKVLWADDYVSFEIKCNACNGTGKAANEKTEP